MLGLLFALALQSATPPPAASDEARMLGRRLAAAGGLAAMIPLMVEKDMAELAKEDAALDPAQRDRLLAIGRAEGRKGIDLLIARLGAAYADRLSVDDLRTLVVQAESPATRRLRAIEPLAIVETMAAMGAIDLKKTTAAAFCRETGKLCDRH